MKNQLKIPTYIINLKRRTDRKDYILREMGGHSEFRINIIEAIEKKEGAVGLWKTIRSIVQKQFTAEGEYILLCEDDHKFTKDYSISYLYSCIAEAQEKDADILLGGVSWFSNIFKTSSKLLWVEKFSGTQFMIIFKKFYPILLDADFEATDSADYKICSLTNSIFCMQTFISVQRNFGYSDATKMNNKAGRVERLFENSMRKVKLLKTVSKFYKETDETMNRIKKSITNDFNHTTIPTYIINLKERIDRRSHIESEFEGRPEFDITVIDAIKHKIGAVGLWLSIRKVIGIAQENEDDVIIICEDDHVFSKSYTKEYLISNIIGSHHQGVDLLSGGTAILDTAVPITNNRFWVNTYYSTQFIVVFRKFFQKILNESFDDKVLADRYLSEMTTNKMVLYPYISTQKDFGYSDCTSSEERPSNTLEQLFVHSSSRLNRIQEAYKRFGI